MGTRCDFPVPPTFTNALFHALCHMNDETFDGYMMVATGDTPLMFLKRMDTDDEQYELIPSQPAMDANPALAQELQGPFDEALRRLDQYRAYRRMSGHSAGHLRQMLSDTAALA